MLSWLRKNCGVLRTNLLTASPFHSKAEKPSLIPLAGQAVFVSASQYKRSRQTNASLAMFKLIFKGHCKRCIALRVLRSLSCLSLPCFNSPAAIVSLALCSDQKLKMDSQKAKSTAAVNWLACYPHSAAWLLRPSGHGFCSTHMLVSARINRTSIADTLKTKTHASHLCFQHSCKPSSFVGL